jgi:hypothetical protein
MLKGRAPKTEGHRGSPRRFDEGGRYLGIPRNHYFAVLRDGREHADDHPAALLSVQETGCDTTRPSREARLVPGDHRRTAARAWSLTGRAGSIHPSGGTYRWITERLGFLCEPIHPLGELPRLNGEWLAWLRGHVYR